MIVMRILAMVGLTTLSFLKQHTFWATMCLFVAQSFVSYISPLLRGFFILLAFNSFCSAWLFLTLVFSQLQSQSLIALKHREPEYILLGQSFFLMLAFYFLGLSFEENLTALFYYLCWGLQMPLLWGQRYQLWRELKKPGISFLLTLSILLTLLIDNSTFLVITIGMTVLQLLHQPLSTVLSSLWGVTLFLRVLSPYSFEPILYMTLSWIEICLLYQGLLYVNKPRMVSSLSAQTRTQSPSEPLPLGPGILPVEL